MTNDGGTAEGMGIPFEEEPAETGKNNRPLPASNRVGRPAPAHGIVLIAPERPDAAAGSGKSVRSLRLGTRSCAVTDEGALNAAGA